MPASPVHTVTDPATGDQVSLRVLARRHGLGYYCVARRHWRGLRGWALVEPVKDVRRRIGIAWAEDRLRRQAEAEQARDLAEATEHPLSRIRLS
ncbi:hypothetical protein EKK97_13820 [Billgrantia tianxiuensis]|uniref:Uncharacterized protein n=1 Tax=Billgrantia tianxiuensis TaxID=2497861 RepID=A0A6I6STZ7_9GAMM|nr:MULTISPECIES: hypothetical protein [Halomonas]MCE8034575.1 hypothetical protein [Halomonas sp. MCCC 1A11057]QHC50443.1 hypothetical protein EKK97_13820 [Halomonas tianxiuensis]